MTLENIIYYSAILFGATIFGVAIIAFFISRQRNKKRNYPSP